MEIIIEGNTPSQKNQKKVRCAGGVPRLYTHPKVKEWQDSALLQLKSKYKGQFDNKVTIAYHFYVKDNRRRDIDNLVASVNDVLVKAGLVSDDDWKHLAIGGADAEVDKDNPRVVLYVEED